MRTPNVDFCAKPILITGAAGFIGSFLAMELLRSVDNVRIVGVDSMNDYYDVALKEHRLRQIEALAAQKPGSRWGFVRGNIADAALLETLFAQHGFGIVVNLAAQAGVRYSITNPDAYVESNLVGFIASWKRAASIRWNTWCTPLPLRCMAPTPRCPTARTTKWISP